MTLIAQVVSFPTDAAEWCTAGASTRLSTYTPWLVKTIEYLDSDYTGRDTRVDAAKNSTSPLQEVVEEVTEEANSCSVSPCGENASCWNGDGRSFLCTCDTGFPHGNPYKKCVKCVYDSHCPLNGTCKDDQCVGSSSQGPQGFLQVTSPRWICAICFLKVGKTWYKVSEEMLAWPQAQYSCMNMQGKIMMMEMMVMMMMVMMNM